MKYKIIQDPTDGYSEEEKILKSVIEQESLKSLYKKLPTNRMRFVVAAHFDLGMSQELIADILGIKQPSLQDEIAHIRKVLSGQSYKPYKSRGVVKIEDVMKALMYMKLP